MASTSVAVRLDGPLKAQIRTLADQRRRPMHWLMREEQRKAFRQEAHEAWHHYQTTGLYVSGAEADAWLAELEAGNDIDPPQAHT